MTKLLRAPIPTVDRLLLRELVQLFIATLGGVVLLYQVIDFADRGSGYHVERFGMASALIELYADKAAVVVLQLAPGALVISVALLLAQLDRRGELTALLSIGLRPRRLAVPISAFALLLGGGMILLQENVVVHADARAEEITAVLFHHWNDYGAWHAQKHWVRGKERRFFLLGERRGEGFEPASVFELEEPFHLVRRLDGRRLEQVDNGRWRLLDAVERRYGKDEIAETKAGEIPLALPDRLEDLALRSGRPRQLPWSDLRQQAVLRAAVGQPDIEYRITIWERLAQPILPLAAALAAFALTLRRRRGKPRPPTLASALALALVLVLGLWALSVVAHAAAVGGTIAPPLAAALPLAACALLTLAAL